MDLEILKTFLEVSRTRHFARAAENLCLTQAAVSARIAQLESRLGTKVFSRQRNNIQLTNAGHRLMPFAEAVISNWSRAVAEVGATPDSPFLSIGYLPSIGEIFGPALFRALSHLCPEVRIQAQQLNTPLLVNRVRDQSVTVGLLYEPPRARDLNVEKISELQLVLVTSSSEVAGEYPDYIQIDWGSSFATTQVNNPVVPSRAGTLLDTPGLAYRLLLEQGGTAYLPKSLVAQDLSAGRLHLARSAPTIPRPIYLIHSSGWQPSADLHGAMEAIRTLASSQSYDASGASNRGRKR